MNQNWKIFGIVVAVVVVVIIGLWLGGVFGKSPVSTQSTGPAPTPLQQEVSNMMCDWARHCPMGQYGSPGGPTFQLPNCVHDPFNPKSLGYSDKAIDALDKIIKEIKSHWPGPHTDSLSWNESQRLFLFDNPYMK